jgi:cytochrome c-type biogenesis protein CcmH
MSDTPPNTQDPLRQLQGLRDAGVLSPQEYAAALERLERGTTAPDGSSPPDGTTGTARASAGAHATPAAPPVPAPGAVTAPTVTPAPAPARVGRRLLLVTLLFTCAVGLGGYAVYGEFTTALNPARQAAPAVADGPPPSPEEIAAMVDRLAERLKERPDDAQGWAMLARSYLVLGRLEEAAQASARALQLQPDSPQALADHADVLAMKNGRTLEGEPMRLIERALQLDPDHLKSLALAGAAAFDRGDMARAAQLWDRVALLGPPGSDITQQAREGAAEARRLATQATAGGSSASAPGPAARAQGTAQPAAASAARVSGRIELAAALKAQARPEDTVYVFARNADATGGNRMPLAIVRAQVKDLPLPFTLDDSQAMGPGMGLSTAKRVVVGARVSRSGQAVPQPGDLEGLSAPVDVGAKDVRIEISRVLP